MNAKNLARRIEKAATLDECHRIADDVLRELRAASRRRNVKVTPSRQQTRREERNARAAEIRAKVMERAGGRCEWCGGHGLVLEWAHIFEGGERRAKEAEDTTAAACIQCHRRGWHRNDLDTLYRAKAWALRNGFAAAGREIVKKIEKVLEARGVPVRIEVGS